MSGLRLAARSLLLILLIIGILVATPKGALAGPVDWHEVASTSEGRQWWDGGSLRTSRGGNVSVLTRFQKTVSEEQPRPLSDLYVMEIDCGQELFRDTSVNGLPQFRAEWQPASGDNLIGSVIGEVCAKAAGGL
ncbi:MAG: hypothetical protein O2839_07940 [Cyanobacteria bacterium]|nr:hypothetical protein [Cyanobacteriota bacterium]MDA1246662.1 hypothetical protein [Cyanobacteriota bacterium]